MAKDSFMGKSAVCQQRIFFFSIHSFKNKTSTKIKSRISPPKEEEGEEGEEKESHSNFLQYETFQTLVSPRKQREGLTTTEAPKPWLQPLDVRTLALVGSQED